MAKSEQTPTRIIDIFSLKEQKGEVGIEIEVEGHHLPRRVEKYWAVHDDGSLRGDETAEYVLSRPVPRDHVGKALQHLVDTWKNHDSRIDTESHRTGVHAHINVQQLTLDQTISFFCLYGILEDLIVKFCGNSREGNLFCLRLRDAEHLITFLVNMVSKGGWTQLASDRIRYASVNMNAIPKYGSMEFRSMRGTDDVDHIKLWIDMLLQIKDQALKYTKPSDMIVHMSGLGEEQFLNAVMGEYAEQLMCKDMKTLIRQGVRRVQELAFTPIYPLKKKLLTTLEPRTPRYRPRQLSAEDVLDAIELARYNELHALGINFRWTREQRAEWDQLRAEIDRRFQVIWEQERVAFEERVRREEERRAQEEQDWDADQPEFEPTPDEPEAPRPARLNFDIIERLIAANPGHQLYTWALPAPDTTEGPIRMRVPRARPDVPQWVVEEVTTTPERNDF
jgi:hypothetical protein